MNEGIEIFKDLCIKNVNLIRYSIITKQSTMLFSTIRE